MKAKIIKIFVLLVMAFVSLPAFCQNYLEIRFKDGIYSKFYLDSISSLYTSKYDENGVGHSDYEFQHVIYNGCDYVCPLSEIDYISFTKYDENKAIENFTTALSEIQPIIINCETIEEAELHINQIKAAGGVEDAWSDGHVLSVKIEGFETITYFFSDDINVNDDYEEEVSNVLSSLKANVANRSNSVSYNDNLKVVIANQHYKNENLYRKKQRKTIEKFRNSLNLCNINATYETNLNLEFFDSRMFDYDIVFLLTHGKFEPLFDWAKDDEFLKDDGYHYLLTTDELGQWKGTSSIDSITYNSFVAKLNQLRNKYPKSNDNHIGIGSTREIRNGESTLVYYAKVSDKFIKEYAKNKFSNPHSLFLNTACQSTKGNSGLIRSLMDRGLFCYGGFNETNGVGILTIVALLRNMLQGESLGNAYKHLGWDLIHDTYYGADFDLRYDYNAIDIDTLFLKPVYTYTDNLLEIENFEDKSCLMEGRCTLIDANNIKQNQFLGFQYGEGVTLNNYNRVYPERIIKDTNGNWNYQFYSILLVPSILSSKDYYYRAFFFDGKNYNNGEIMPLSGFSSDYKYVYQFGAYAMDEEGTYTIGTSPINYHYTWIDHGDHTDGYNGKGHMLIVNGATDNNLYVWKKSYPVVEGKKYQFSAWFISTLESKPLDKNMIEYNIDGNTNIGTYDRTENGWERYKGSYTATKTGLIEIKIRTKSTIAVGNDFAIDDIYFAEFQSWDEDNPEPEETDLGLPSGTKWANKNLGASSPEDYGGYFAWGNTGTRYIRKNDNSQNSANNEFSSNNSTSSRFDLAQELWGDNWKVPTKSQIDELIEYCTITWVEQNGVYGNLVKGPNGRTIFLPAAGYKADWELIGEGNDSYFWSSTLNENSESEAYSLDIVNGEWHSDTHDIHNYEFSIRPISKLDNIIEVNPTTIDFGKLKYGDSQIKQFKVRNVGKDLLKFYVSETHGEIDIPLSGKEMTLGIDHEMTFDVIYTPSLDNSSCNITVSIFSNADNGTQTIDILGSREEYHVICPDDNHPHMIDLGVPSGTKWSCCNVDATNPEEYGGYYAWGETKEKSIYNDVTYWFSSGVDKDGDGMYDEDEAGKTIWDYIGKDIVNTEYDVAHVKWGKDWRMPSNEQIRELYYCSSKWGTQNGVNGLFVTGPNGNTIFLPAAGNRFNSYDTLSQPEGRLGQYWSSTLRSYYAFCAYVIDFADDRGIGYDVWQEREYGLPVRPVWSPNILFADAAVKAICVDNWDTNADGELSYDEAAAVKHLGDAFYQKQSISSFEELRFFKGLTIIDEEAFRECSLKSIVIPKGIKTIGKKAFMQCPNLSEVTLPEGVTWIDEEAFAECALKSITLPESLIRIGEKAFENTFLKKVTLPKNVAYLGNSDEDELYGGVFDYCYSLKEVNVDESNRKYASIDGVLTTKDKKFLLFYPYARVEDMYSVPEGIEQIHYKAFYECKINAVTLPRTLKSFYTYKDEKPVFSNSTGLRRIRANMMVPFECDENSFSSETYSSAILYVPQGTKAMYEKTVGWSRFQRIVEVEDVAEAIDLGLPSGTKWASWNVGASTPEGYGGYYAWGETEEKDYYDWITYKYYNSEIGEYIHIGDDIAGTEYDVAHVKWGGSWRMPTRAQQDELRENCTREWTQQNGVNGIRVTGPNGNSIFLPAAGYRWYDYLGSEGEYGYYWSSSFYPDDEGNAGDLGFGSDNWSWDGSLRYDGQSVRAVCP